MSRGKWFGADFYSSIGYPLPPRLSGSRLGVKATHLGGDNHQLRLQGFSINMGTGATSGARVPGEPPLRVPSPRFHPEPARAQRSGKPRADEVDTGPPALTVPGPEAGSRGRRCRRFGPDTPGRNCRHRGRRAGSSRLRTGGGARGHSPGRHRPHLPTCGAPPPTPRGGPRPPAPSTKGRRGAGGGGRGSQARAPGCPRSGPWTARGPGRRRRARAEAHLGGRATGAARRPPAAGRGGQGGGQGGGAGAPGPRAQPAAQPWLRQEVRGRGGGGARGQWRRPGGVGAAARGGAWTRGGAALRAAGLQPTPGAADPRLGSRRGKPGRVPRAPRCHPPGRAPGRGRCAGTGVPGWAARWHLRALLSFGSWLDCHLRHPTGGLR